MGTTMGTGNVHDDDLETLQFADESEYIDDGDEEGCEGHESLSGAHMGVTVHCDGSCLH